MDIPLICDVIKTMKLLSDQDDIVVPITMESMIKKLKEQLSFFEMNSSN
jgi:hypothetical protein